MVCGAILLHLGIALNMGLVVFSLFMFTLLLAWMPPRAIRRLFEDTKPSTDGDGGSQRRELDVARANGVKFPQAAVATAKVMN